MRLDDLTINVYIGEGDQWPDEVNPILKSIVYHKMIYIVGACELVLDDRVGVIGTKFKLEDGVKLKIETGNGSDIETFNYRVIKVSRVGNRIYHIIGFEDQPKLLYGGSTSYYEENSSDGIKKLAQECGMQAEVDSTSDKQVWMGYGRSNFHFARFMAQYGYASDKSLMWLTSYKGKLLYKDLNAIDASPKAIFTLEASNNSKGDTYVIHHMETMSRSGINNGLGGYGFKTIDTTITEEDEKEYDKIEVKKRADKEQINEDIRSQVSESPPTKIGALRSDNTHDNYIKAKYQNARGFLALSERIMVVTQQQTTLKLLDTVEVSVGGINNSVKDPGENQVNTFDGTWLVDSRIIQIEPPWYFEVYVLRREGVKSS
jgi:hypothetical protein